MLSEREGMGCPPLPVEPNTYVFESKPKSPTRKPPIARDPFPRNVAAVESNAESRARVTKVWLSSGAVTILDPQKVPVPMLLKALVPPEPLLREAIGVATEPT